MKHDKVPISRAPDATSRQSIKYFKLVEIGTHMRDLDVIFNITDENLERCSSEGFWYGAGG